MPRAGPAISLERKARAPRTRTDHPVVPTPFAAPAPAASACRHVVGRRFNFIEKRYRDRAQFIVVTHQKRTMEAADTLYGANTSCGSASCTGSIRTAAGKCDTGGTCVSGAQTSCVTGCNGTDCAALLAEGSTCSSNAQCQSGACGLGAGTTNVHNTCNSLAGTVNQTCYFDSTCRSSNLVCNGNATDPKCVACGTSGGQCCPGSTYAAAGLYCNSGYCAACGSSGQPCCPGSPATCLTGYACVSGSYCGGVAGTSCYGSVSPCAPPLVCPLGAGSVCTAP